MTALTDAPIKSHDAARGARLARLQQIDITYTALRDTVDAGHYQAWTAAINGSCARIATITAGIDVDTDAVLLHSSLLRVFLARRRLFAEARVMEEDLARLTRRYLLALAEVEEAWDAERFPFDFDIEATA